MQNQNFPRAVPYIYVFILNWTKASEYKTAICDERIQIQNA